MVNQRPEAGSSGLRSVTAQPLSLLHHHALTPHSPTHGGDVDAFLLSSQKTDPVSESGIVYNVCCVSVAVGACASGMRWHFYVQRPLVFPFLVALGCVCVCVQRACMHVRDCVCGSVSG